jgi:RNA polymerase sigma factor (TIGR02999 family)
MSGSDPVLPPANDTITCVLAAVVRGEPRAAEQLLPLVYDELRRLAAARLAHEAPGQTLSATALVHEAYLRLVGDDPHKDWDGRRHFFAAAVEAMRRILIDAARRKWAVRHGGGRNRQPLEEDLTGLVTLEPDDRLLALDEALTRLAAVDPAKAELVRLRIYAGLAQDEAAAALGLSRATAARHWAYARAWLYDAIEGSPPAGREAIHSENFPE